MEPLNLVALDDSELEEVRKTYRGFFSQGNSEMKAAYLAVTELGFNEIFKSNREHTVMVRLKDLKYVVFAYKPKKSIPVDFHCNLNVFEG